LPKKPAKAFKEELKIEQTVLHRKGKGEKLALQSHCNALLKIFVYLLINFLLGLV